MENGESPTPSQGALHMEKFWLHVMVFGKRRWRSIAHNFSTYPFPKCTRVLPEDALASPWGSSLPCIWPAETTRTEDLYPATWHDPPPKVAALDPLHTLPYPYCSSTKH